MENEELLLNMVMELQNDKKYLQSVIDKLLTKPKLTTIKNNTSDKFTDFYNEFNSEGMIFSDAVKLGQGLNISKGTVNKYLKKKDYFTKRKGVYHKKNNGIEINNEIIDEKIEGLPF